MSQTTPQDETGSLAGDGPLPTLLGEGARSKIIEAFVRNASRDLNVSDIARLSDTTRTTVYDHLDVLIELDVVTKVERGNTTLYTLNDDDEIAKLLNQLQGTTLRRLLQIEQDVEL